MSKSYEQERAEAFALVESYLRELGMAVGAPHADDFIWEPREGGSLMDTLEKHRAVQYDPRLNGLRGLKLRGAAPPGMVSKAVVVIEDADPRVEDGKLVFESDGRTFRVDLRRIVEIDVVNEGDRHIAYCATALVPRPNLRGAGSQRDEHGREVVDTAHINVSAAVYAEIWEQVRRDGSHAAARSEASEQG